MFEYLNKDNGVIIQVIHTGTSSNDISVVGDIKGATIKKVNIGKHTYLSRFLSGLLGGLYALFLCTLILVATALISLILFPTQPSDDKLQIAVIPALFIMILATMYSFWVTEKTFLLRAPKGLDGFIDTD